MIRWNSDDPHGIANGISIAASTHGFSPGHGPYMVLRVAGVNDQQSSGLPFFEARPRPVCRGHACGKELPHAVRLDFCDVSLSQGEAVDLCPTTGC